jgi:hypothetical protein
MPPELRASDESLYPVDILFDTKQGRKLDLLPENKMRSLRNYSYYLGTVIIH